jgi:hypothetical protein
MVVIMEDVIDAVAAEDLIPDQVLVHRMDLEDVEGARD